MAFNTSSLQEYLKQDYAPLVKDLALRGGTVERMRWQTDVKGSASINIVQTNPVFQAGDCAWNPSGDAAFTQRVINTALLKVNMEFCDKDLIPYWTQYDVNISADEHALPFEEYILRDVINNTANKREELIWQGDSTNAGEPDGLLKILGADAAVIDVAVAQSTSAYDAIEQMVKAIPAAVLRKGVKINVSPEVYRLFILSLVKKNYYHYGGPTAELPMEFKFPGTNISVVETPGLAGTLKMVASTDDNLVYGTDLTSDNMSIIKVGYDEKTSAHWLRIDFNFGVQVAFPDLVVLGTFAAAPTE